MQAHSANLLLMERGGVPESSQTISITRDDSNDWKHLGRWEKTVQSYLQARMTEPVSPMSEQHFPGEVNTSIQKRGEEVYLGLAKTAGPRTCFHPPLAGGTLPGKFRGSGLDWSGACSQTTGQQVQCKGSLPAPLSFLTDRGRSLCIQLFHGVTYEPA